MPAAIQPALVMTIKFFSMSIYLRRLYRRRHEVVRSLTSVCMSVRALKGVFSSVKQQVRLSSGTDVYPHMPIVRVASALDESASARATRMIKPPYELHTRIYPSLVFWGTKVPHNRFPAQDADEQPCKI